MKNKVACLSCILAALFCARAAHAAVIMTLEQVGPNLVATGSGTVDLAGLTFNGGGALPSLIQPLDALFVEGNGGEFDMYYAISGPPNFGTGALTLASTGSGDPLGFLAPVDTIIVPQGYVSGTPLSSTATWNSTTLAALGATPGIYTYTWGSGPVADSLTLYIGVPAPPSVPEPAPALLLTLAAAAFALSRFGIKFRHLQAEVPDAKLVARTGDSATRSHHR